MLYFVLVASSRLADFEDLTLNNVEWIRAWVSTNRNRSLIIKLPVVSLPIFSRNIFISLQDPGNTKLPGAVLLRVVTNFILYCLMVLGGFGLSWATGHFWFS